MPTPMEVEVVNREQSPQSIVLVVLIVVMPQSPQGKGSR